MKGPNLLSGIESVVKEEVNQNEGSLFSYHPEVIESFRLKNQQGAFKLWQSGCTSRVIGYFVGFSFCALSVLIIWVFDLFFWDGVKVFIGVFFLGFVCTVLAGKIIKLKSS